MFLLSPAHVGGVAGDGNQMLLLSIIYDVGGEKRDLFSSGDYPPEKDVHGLKIKRECFVERRR